MQTYRHTVDALAVGEHARVASLHADNRRERRRAVEAVHGPDGDDVGDARDVDERRGVLRGHPISSS